VASELGPNGIRANALSSGPIQTRAASGIPGFDGLMDRIVSRTPTGRPVTIDEVGNAAVFLVSDASSATTGSIQFVDGGFHNFG
jgi:enoyl-[acyl-carrier protein] reductase I